MIRIANGTVVDGTGNPAYAADVIVDGDRIVDIVRRPPPNQTSQTSLHLSNLSSQTPPPPSPNPRNPRNPLFLSPSPNQTIPNHKSNNLNNLDATGCIVSPGFIDAHSHSDAYLILEPDAPSKLSQGVTTEINGQCGGSVAPRYGEARLSSDWASLLGERLTWRSMAEYREALEAAKPSINTVQFVGHNTLRSSAMGYAARAAGEDDLKAMKRLLEEALDEGGWGLTTGLIYQPGRYSTPEEVVELARVAAAKGGFYATHMRSEGDAIVEAIDEVLQLVRATGIRAEISHLKTSGRRNWHKIDAVLEKIDRAVGEGLLLGSDRYPYCAAGTDLDVILPDWAQEGAAKAECERLADAPTRRRIADEIDRSDRDWSSVMIGGTWSEATKRYSGRTIAEILAARATPSASPGELVCAILAADRCRTGAFFFGMSEDNLAKIYSMPWIVPGSDASLRAPWGPLGADHPHPRAYGTMPEFYRRLRELGFSREETVARMTSVPARRFGLKGRGVIEKGAFADIAVWDEMRFRSAATYEKPHQFAEGVKAVLVNGRQKGGGRFLSRS